MRTINRYSVTQSIEYFEPKLVKYGEVTLIDAYDSFTHNLVQTFLKLGAPVKVFRSKDVSVSDVENEIGSYLVLSPGPGVPSDAGILKDVISRFYEEIPILGVCLGMQAINEVFGGITAKAPKIVHGKQTKIFHDGTGIFEDIPDNIFVGRYHSLQVDQVSTEFVIQSTIDSVPMAFHIPNKLAGVQFHPESFLTEYGLEMLSNFLEMKL